MAYEASAYAVKVTLAAGADLSAVQYLFVKPDASANAILCAAATDIPLGVIQNSPRWVSGKYAEEAEVLVIGVSKVTAGAAIAIGALVGTDAAGKAVTLVPGTDVTKYVVGRALTAAGGANEIITIALDAAAPHRAT